MSEKFVPEDIGSVQLITELELCTHVDSEGQSLGVYDIAISGEDLPVWQAENIPVSEPYLVVYPSQMVVYQWFVKQVFWTTVIQVKNALGDVIAGRNTSGSTLIYDPARPDWVGELGINLTWDPGIGDLWNFPTPVAVVGVSTGWEAAGSWGLIPPVVHTPPIGQAGVWRKEIFSGSAIVESAPEKNISYPLPEVLGVAAGSTMWVNSVQDFPGYSYTMSGVKTYAPKLYQWALESKFAGFPFFPMFLPLLMIFSTMGLLLGGGNNVPWPRRRLPV